MHVLVKVRCPNGSHKCQHCQLQIKHCAPKSKHGVSLNCFSVHTILWSSPRSLEPRGRLILYPFRELAFEEYRVRKLWPGGHSLSWLRVTHEWNYPLPFRSDFCLGDDISLTSSIVQIANHFQASHFNMKRTQHHHVLVFAVVIWELPLDLC